MTNYRFNVNQINENLDYIKSIIDQEVDECDPYALTSKLSKICCVLGMASICCSSAEYLYQSNKKDPVNQELRVKSETMNKNIHYCITAIQTIIGVVKLDIINSKNQ